MTEQEVRGFCFLETLNSLGVMPAEAGIQYAVSLLKIL